MGHAAVSKLHVDPQAVWASPAAMSLMSYVNAVVGVDSALGHLAGALGTTCYLLLGFGHDPQWGFCRRETPWYPRLHLYGQNAPMGLD
jgi:ADP-heptose:LPS heptosyltransferase